jgi:hypothetical protein
LETNAIVATASFTVERAGAAIATLELRPPRGEPGDPVRIVGTGWDPRKGDVRIFLDSSASTKPDAVVAPGSDETFTAAFDVPDLDPGSYTVLVCQRCNGPNRVEQVATFEVLAAGPSPWWWILVGSVLLVGAGAAIAALVRHQIRVRERRQLERIRVNPRLDEPEVQVAGEPDGSPHHTIELTPHADRGEQRVLEGSSS